MRDYDPDPWFDEMIDVLGKGANIIDGFGTGYHNDGQIFNYGDTDGGNYTQQEIVTPTTVDNPWL
jgi:hypothetical protein